MATDKAEAQRLYKAKHPERIVETTRKYQEKHAAKILAARNSPRGKYSKHKSNAKRRGVEWLFTFKEWWAIWEPYWGRRGQGSNDLQMCRPNDEGPYSPDNVRIDTCKNNSLEMIARHGPPSHRGIR